MSEAFWRKLSVLTGLFALAAVFGLTIFAANLEIKDLDLWLHIGTGRYIIEHHFQVPKTDVLSCTIAGKPWNNHEWLFQVIVSQIFERWGADGLINMQVALVALTMLVLFFLGYNRDKQLTTIFFLLLVSLVYQGRFTIRPDLYSLLFFALDILLLSFYLHRRWVIYAFFVIQVLWTNIHGFFFFGPLFVLLGLFGEWLKRSVRLPYQWNKAGRLTNEEYRRLKFVLAAVLLACVFNPQLIKGALYPFTVIFQLSGDSKIFFEKIVELKRPITSSTIFSLQDYPYYRLLIILSAMSFYFNRRKLDVGIFIFWLVFLFFSLSAIRNLIFFAFAAYLVIVTNALAISFKNLVPINIKDKRFQHITAIVAKAGLAIWIFNYGSQMALHGYYDFAKYERKSEYWGVSLRSFPQRVVDFLVENKVKGNFFNDFNSGAYLVGRTYPDIKVFIDGRTELYGPQFFKYYQSIWEKDNADEFVKALDKYQLTGVFLNSNTSPIPKKVLKRLCELKDWVPVYFDYDGVIFLKDTPENQAVIKAHQIDFAKIKPYDIDLYRFGPMRAEPYQPISRGITLYSMGYDDAAVKEAQIAIKMSPNFMEPYKILGRVYAQKKDYELAFENFRIAVMYAPDAQDLHISLAKVYDDLKKYEFAIREYKKIIDRWPHDQEAYFGIARSYLNNQEFDKAIHSLKVAHKIAPEEVDDILEIADRFFSDEKFALARDAYELIVSQEKRLDEICLRLGKIYVRLNENEKAKEAFERGLQHNADNRELKNELRRLQPEKQLEEQPTPEIPHEQPTLGDQVPSEQLHRSDLAGRNWGW